MKRELKFRAWIDVFGEMEYQGDKYLGSLSNFMYYYAEYTLMQSTGFTDKNGVEIYEGDILGDWVGTDRGLVQSAKQVYWCQKKGAWMLDSGFKQNKTFGDLLGKELRHYDYEVRGNIYENAELLVQPSFDSLPDFAIQAGAQDDKAKGDEEPAELTLNTEPKTLN